LKSLQTYRDIFCKVVVI